MKNEGKDQVVIATAGHVDHGKTTLIKKLTGIDTDTMEAEKKRGLTINLGFAFFDLPNHEKVGIVDVPGHEKFLKNMIAGLNGIDLVLLVVDANEGVMPQTIEHMDILNILGIKNYIGVITKIDTADDEMQELVHEDLQELFDSYQISAPIVGVDSVSGTGIEALKTLMDQRIEAIDTDKTVAAPRINIDRAFTIKGFGAVVTGTLLEGPIKVGETLYLYPTNKEVKVRGIQVHGNEVTEAYPGTRTAINLANIKASEIDRGYVLTTKDNIKPTWMLDGSFKLSRHYDPNKFNFSFDFWTRVRVYIGAREIMARVVPLGNDNQIVPDAENYVQLRLEEPIAVKKGDKFILRSYSPMILLGGGEILDANPDKHKKTDTAIVEKLQVIDSGSMNDLVELYLDDAPKYLRTLSGMVQDLNLSQADLEQLLDEMAVRQFGKYYMSETKFKELKTAVRQILDDFHEQNELLPGIGKGELFSRLDLDYEPKVIEAILLALEQEQVIETKAAVVCRAGFEPQLNQHQKQLQQEILTDLQANDGQPRLETDLYQDTPDKKPILIALETSGVIKRLTVQEVILNTNYESLKQKTIDYLKQHQMMTIADFRDLTGSSRKNSMMILENFDKDKVTRRIENERKLYMVK